MLKNLTSLPMIAMLEIKNFHFKNNQAMEKYMNYFIHKIGGAGLMMLYQELFDWVNYTLKDKGPDTQIVIVVSAFVKITRVLEKIFEKKLNGEIEKAMQIFEDDIRKIHLQRCTSLSVKDTSILYEYFHEIEYFIRNGSIDEKNPTISKAQLLRFGELMSSEIFRQFLLGMNLSVKLIDAQDMVYASGDDYCNSIPLQPQTSENISKAIAREHGDKIILTQGYISHKRLLGLDGSDLTASLITLGLRSCNPNLSPTKTFWKDVDGVMVGGIVQEKMELNEYNSLETVPVRKDAINIDPKTETVIRSFLNLENPGTTIVR
ncbi:MAG: hypothetical protein WC603_00625 [Candidatus Paceibacterota bacterium]|jgi:aspartokinase